MMPQQHIDEHITMFAALLHDRADDIADCLLDLGIDADDLIAELPIKFHPD
jgi:hypothetical protein